MGKETKDNEREREGLWGIYRWGCFGCEIQLEKGVLLGVHFVILILSRDLLLGKESEYYNNNKRGIGAKGEKL